MSNRLLLVIVVFGIASLGGVRPAAAQDASPPEQAWEASVRHDYDRVSDGRTDWNRWTAALKREFSSGTLVATFTRQQRFGITDEGGAVDAWRDLWTGAYGHLQLAISPDARIRSQRAVQAELYQSVGSWELSGQYWWRRYRRENVHLIGPGLARYVGSWYLRTRTTIVPRQATWAFAQRIGARRYYGSSPSSSYVDAEAGVGRGVELVGPDADLLVTRTFFASLRVRHVLTSHLGLTAALRYSDDDVFSRTGGAVGLFVQW